MLSVASSTSAHATAWSPDGFTLSPAVRFEEIACPTSFPGPVGDDAPISITLGGPPNCMTASPFCGVSQTVMHVRTNGRVELGGAANTAFTPSVATAQAEGLVGCWAGSRSGANASDMLYNLGVAPSNGGRAEVSFVPNANNIYNRTAT